MGRRSIWSPGLGQLVDAAVYNGHQMGVGAELSGPAIVELKTTTIVVLDEYDLLVDELGSFVVYQHTRAGDIRARLGPVDATTVAG